MSVQLTNLDRVLWPEAGFTKGAMIEYYRRVAHVLLPHLAGRPLTMWRFPLGVHERGWWQNECRGRPPWMATAEIRGQQFCIVDDLPSLVWAANLGAVELHPYLARGDRPDQPTVVVFDLDPGAGADTVACCRAAVWLREALDELGLVSFAKTSGSLGLHVYVPLNAHPDFAETKAFARALARRLAAEHPDHVVDEARRSARAGKVLVDWLQNDATRSTVAAYSLRATRRPTVSTPVTWDEVERTLAEAKPELLAFEPAHVLARLDRFGDLFRPVLELTQTLPSPASAR